MDPIRRYDIDIQGLKQGIHRFDYLIDDAFFALFEYSPVDKGSLEAVLELERGEAHLTLNFDIRGTVGLICDRSLEPFDHPLQLKERLILKFGDQPQEVSDELEIIPSHKQTINVARFIYEYIAVSIPMKRLRPELIGEDETNEGLVYSSNAGHQDTPNKDPRWEALEKLVRKKN